MFADSFILWLTDAASEWLLTYLIHSTLLLVGVWGVTSLTSLRDATRDVLWKLALVGGLVSASVQSIVGREPLGGQVELAARRAHEAASVRVAVREVEGRGRRVFVAESRGTRWTPVVVVLWVTGAGCALLWLPWGHARAARALSDRTSLDGSPIASRLRALLARSRVRREVVLTCSAGIASPVALVNGEVCLPRRALVELEAVEQESMLAHEVAHVVRRDPHWLIAARVIEAIFFVQPLNRLARRRMQAVAEFLCDDWAVQRTSHPVTLARCLAAVAEWVGRAPRLSPMSAMVQSSGSPLVQRVRRILGGGHEGRVQSSRGAVCASVGVLVALAVVAPRISIAGEIVSDRTMMFVRAIAPPDREPGPRDTVVIVRTTSMRVSADSVRSVRVGPMAGRLVGRGDIVIQRIPQGAIADSSGIVTRTWTHTRRVPDGAAAGAMPVATERQGRLFRIERLTLVDSAKN